MKGLFFTMAVLFTLAAFSQELPGFSTSNYTGVTGVFFNPSSVADSRHKWDFLPGALAVHIGNDKAGIHFKDVIKNKINTDSLLNRILGNQAGLTSGFFHLNVLGPSLLITTSKKSGLALTTRVRGLANIYQVDGRLLNEFISTNISNNYPYTLTATSPMKVVANVWGEAGITYGRSFSITPNHFIKAGITLKYLAGAANYYIETNNTQATVAKDASQDIYIQQATGSLSLATPTIGEKMINDFVSTGMGGDIGITYEYRKNDASLSDRGQNKYLLKAGLSLLDLGKIKYKPNTRSTGSYNISITGTEKWYFKKELDKGLDSVKQYLDGQPQFFTPNGSSNESSTSLPTTLRLDVDYALTAKVYVNMGLLLPLTTNTHMGGWQYQSITITPRYESRGIGCYVPVSLNSLTGLNAGVGLRLGPVFIGSGSLLTAIAGNSKKADFYIGLHLGSLFDKAKKISTKKN